MEKGKGAHEPKAQKAGAYTGFIGMKHLGALLLPLDGMLVHRRVTPQEYVAGTHLYTFEKRDKEKRFAKRLPPSYSSPSPFIVDTG